MEAKAELASARQAYATCLESGDPVYHRWYIDGISMVYDGYRWYIDGL
jgi:hypothetical protein